ncbi:hypothetical protein CN231_12945 [Sinorhizobium meliloti]|nr:hypothetical protein [Sinorhizobium meliloti]MQX19898.1 hypothetical protein [Sinorhizobium meliloti]RVG17465.1 hypothetical protein CN231_12945 [Sinorhizobium meliloti]RVI66114.1 hypothetical protein CN189_09820 [Sinorhizobium meliloti]
MRSIPKDRTLSTSSLCSSQESSSAASAARESLFSPRTWSGWIPVTSTGMREAGMHGRYGNLRSKDMRAISLISHGLREAF